jgi:hypothetical protein
MHTTTPISSISTSAVSSNITKARGINFELSFTVEGYVGLHQNTLCTCRLSTGRIRNISETA